MADRIDKRLGDYRLIRFLGEGTFGDVYYGEHVYQNTPAAIKAFKTKLTPDKLRDFINEVRTLMLLKHPNIIQLLDFDIGENDIPSYLVMEYAPNGTLRQRHPGGTRLQLATIVTYVKQLAAALQYAHTWRRIHRDVKPANMLIGHNNDVLLSDFGIVAVAHSEGSMTTQKMAGTVPYMAPEQILGKPHPASDQYALGIVVYEWLCGVRPFQGETEYAIMKQHLEAPPPPLRTKLPTILPEVEQVVLTALVKDPSQRFKSVQAFADALEQTYQPKPSIGATLLTYRGHTDGVETVAWSLDSRRIASGSRDGTVQIWDAVAGTRLFTYDGHDDRVNAVAWSPDNRQIASGSKDETVQVWDVVTGTRLVSYTGHSAQVEAIAWSPDGKQLASGSDDRTVQVWDAITKARYITYGEHAVSVYAVIWSPDGRRIASGSLDGTIQVWNAATGTGFITYGESAHWLGAMAWSPDGKQIASGSLDGTIQVWDAITGAELVTYRMHSHGIMSIAWSPDSKCIASGSADKTVQVANATTGARIVRYSEHSDEVRAVAWSPDGRQVASGSLDGTIQVWQAV